MPLKRKIPSSLNPFDYTGTATRKNYWFCFLIYTLFLLLCVCVMYFTHRFRKNSGFFIIFSWAIDLILFMNLCAIHIRLVNAAGKPLWAFFIPFYNLYFLFRKPSKPAENDTDNTEQKISKKKRYWLIPIFIIMGFLVGFADEIITLEAGEEIDHYVSSVKQEKLLENQHAEAKRMAEEIAKRVPSNAIAELNDENYRYASALEELYYFIRDNYDSEEQEDSLLFYKENYIYSLGAPSITIVNNQLLHDYPIQIGDSVEDLYRTFGALKYNLGKESDSVEFYFQKSLDSDYVRYYSVTFIITDGRISQIKGLFE